MELEKEVWKDIKGYEGLYQVSNLGRFYGIKRDNYLSLKPSPDKYVRVILSKNGKPNTFTAHQLVARNFIENPEGFIEINHIDGNQSNNCVSNLEWCDRKGNLRHAFENGLHCSPMKPVIQLDSEGLIVEEFESITEAARATNLHRSRIQKCLKDHYRVTGGYYWRLKED
ncbi:TPA: NUMOD4 domain-containing protein [Bacillus pacificus]